MSFAQHFLLFFVCATLAQTVNISENDWTTLKSFFSASGCKSSFCNTLQMNRSCVWPVICNNVTGDVLQLQLNAYNLSGRLIDEIAQFTSLQALILSNNQFHAWIPAGLARMSSLKLLDISNNRFFGPVSSLEGLRAEQIVIHGNELTGVVPFFPNARNCSLQTFPDRNNFCCSKGVVQPCCVMSSLCNCARLSPCSGYASIPDRCSLNDDNDDGPNYALCTTRNTIGNQVDKFVLPVTNRVLSVNFTVSFWAKAREPLRYFAATGDSGIVHSIAGTLLNAFVFDSYLIGLGFVLGTDGFDLYAVRQGSRYVILGALREKLDGWHHYSIVQRDGESSVYIDQNLMQLIPGAVKYGTNNSVAFDICLGNSRKERQLNKDPASGFEGWISELRLANRSMIGGEAYRQRNNDSAWDFIHPMQGCSGENHTGTEIEQFGIQQAFLVCKEPLPTCGVVKEEFSVGEQAGCLCESDDGTRSCLVGEWSTNDTVVAKPLARWLLNDVNSSMALDSSGNGFHGNFVGVRGVDYNVSASHTSFNGGYIDFGNRPEFNFGKRDFFISMSFRMQKKQNGTYFGYVLSKQNLGTYDYGWVLYTEVDGSLSFWILRTSVTDLVGLPLGGGSIADNQWHTLFLSARNTYFELSMDNGFLHNFVNNVDREFYNRERLLVGGLSFLRGDIANVSIYVDFKPGPICLANSIGYQSLSSDVRCKRVVGFCSPSKQDRQCCGARNCLECNTYRTCSRSFSLNAKTNLLSSSTTTTTTPLSSSTNNTLSTTSSLLSSSTTTNSTSAIIDVAANSQLLPTIGWIGVVIGTLIYGLLVGISICMILRKRSTLSPSQTSLDEFHSVKNNDDESSQQHSRYSAIPPKPDHPYVDASFISIAEANEEIGRAMEQEANSKKSIEIHY